MEDGIDRNLYICPIQEIKPEKYLYVCTPNESVSDLIITFEKEKAIKLMREKKYTIDIFKKNKENLYVPSYDCLFFNLQ
jgi:hypothetical protein